MRPELLRADRLDNDQRYPYVDGDGNALELTEDVDSEASPTDPSDEDEDEDNQSVDTLDAMVEDAMYGDAYDAYGEDFY